MPNELTRRLFLSSGAAASVAALAIPIGFDLSESARAQEIRAARKETSTLALEEFAKRGCKYCDRMVDKNAYPILTFSGPIPLKLLMIGRTSATSCRDSSRPSSWPGA